MKLFLPMLALAALLALPSLVSAAPPAACSCAACGCAECACAGGVCKCPSCMAVKHVVNGRTFILTAKQASDKELLAALAKLGSDPFPAFVPAPIRETFGPTFGGCANGQCSPSPARGIFRR